MKQLRRSLRRPRRARGSSLIEVLIAMTVLALLMVGILEMYSLSLVVNAGAAARTQMTFKAQQVVENIRIVYGMYRASAVFDYNFVPPSGCGIPLPLSPGGAPPDTDFVLPDNAAADATAWAFWGPAGANVMEIDDGPYQIRFNIRNAAATSSSDESVIVTVTVEASTSTTARRYFSQRQVTPGEFTLNAKRIDYVARILTSPI